MQQIRYHERFKQFLTDEAIYQANQAYWRSVVVSIVGQEVEDWVLNTYANGVEIMDGNPLFSCKLDAHKALRIIQEKRDLAMPLFTSWVSQYDNDGTTIEELVIAIQPYQKIYEAAATLIARYWEGSHQALQTRLNQHYDEKTSENKVRYVLKELSNSSLLDHKWNISSNEGMKFNVKYYSIFKKINKISDVVSYYETAQEHEAQNPLYHNVVDQLNALEEIVTLEDTYDLEAGFNWKAYLEHIEDKYSDFNAFAKQYNAGIQKLATHYQALKQRQLSAAP